MDQPEKLYRRRMQSAFYTKDGAQFTGPLDRYHYSASTYDADGEIEIWKLKEGAVSPPPSSSENPLTRADGAGDGDVMRAEAWGAEYLGPTDEESVPRGALDRESRIWTCYATRDREEDARTFVAQHA